MKSGAFLVVKIAISAALVYWLAVGMDLDAALARLGGIAPAWLFAVFAVLSLQAVLAAARWQAVLATGGARLVYGTALRLFAISMFFNQTLSSTVGGDVARVWLLRRHGVALGAGTGSVILERVAGLVALAFLAVPGMVLAPSDVAPLLAAIAMAAACAVMFVAAARRLAGARRAGVRRLGTGAATVAAVLFTRAGFGILTCSLLIHALAGGAVWGLARGLGLDLALGLALVLVPPVLLLATLPISFGGWGVREGAFLVLAPALGLSAADAVGLSILFGLVVMAAGLPGGLVWLSVRGRGDGPSTPQDRTASSHPPDAAPQAVAARPEAVS